MLLPPALQGWLPEDPLAVFISDVVDHALDLSPTLTTYETSDGRAAGPAVPREPKKSGEGRPSMLEMAG